MDHGQIPFITSELFHSPTTNTTSTTALKKEEEDASMNAIEQNQRSILDRIIQAMRFLLVEKLEPLFIRQYCANIVTSPTVRSELYQ